MVRSISDTAYVSGTAQVADGCCIGSFSQIGSGVELKPKVSISEHVWIGSRTLIEKGSCVASHALLGTSKSSQKACRSPLIKVGQDVRIGRAVVIEPGCPSVPTLLGDRCVMHSLAKIESTAQLSSDVQVGSGVIIGRKSILDQCVNIGHGTVVHPGIHLGRNCAIGAMSIVTNDVPPHMITDGRPSRVRCVNVAGLHRLSVEPHAITSLVEAHKLIYKMGLSLDKAELQLRSSGCLTAEVIEVIEFLRASADKARGYRCNQGRVA